MARWATGSFSVLGRGVPEASLLFFSLFLLFLFLFSYILYTLCILNPNDFKPNAKVLLKFRGTN
jgi:hypothetical protein